MTGPSQPLLVTVTGKDHPGLAAALFAALSSLEVKVLDVEQVQIHGRLLLGVLLEGADPSIVRATLRSSVTGAHIDGHHVESPEGPFPLDEGAVVSVGPLDTLPSRRSDARHLVTVLAPTLSPSTLAGIFRRLASTGVNVDQILRLSTYPVTAYELAVSGGDHDDLRRELGAEAARLHFDVAVQRAGLHRRAKRLIVLDVDSTLVQGEVIDLLAKRAGCEKEVGAVTAAAMSGEIDFESALRERVHLLTGLEQRVLDEVRDELVLTPGARTLVRTLKRLGYVTAVVSGGFDHIIEPLAKELGIDHVAANTLEITDGKLTGRLVGPIVDRAGKASSLVEFARLSDVPLAQTVAVGDGANDLDMLATAGLGIAFNAKPVVRHAADTSINVPYLDSILFLIGLSREEIEAADADPLTTR